MTMAPTELANIQTGQAVRCSAVFDLGSSAALAQPWMSAIGEVSIRVCSIGMLANPPAGTFVCEVSL